MSAAFGRTVLVVCVCVGVWDGVFTEHAPSGRHPIRVIALRVAICPLYFDLGADDQHGAVSLFLDAPLLAPKRMMKHWVLHCRQYVFFGRVFCVPGISFRS